MSDSDGEANREGSDKRLKPSSKSYGCCPSDPVALLELRQAICYFVLQYKKGSRGESRKHWEKVSKAILETTGAIVHVDWLRRNQFYISHVLLQQVDLSGLDLAAMRDAIHSFYPKCKARFYDPLPSSSSASSSSVSSPSSKPSKSARMDTSDDEHELHEHDEHAENERSLMLVYARQTADNTAKANVHLASIDNTLKKMERQGKATKDVRDTMAAVIANEKLDRQSKHAESEDKGGDGDEDPVDLTEIKKGKSKGLHSEVAQNTSEKGKKPKPSPSSSSSSFSSPSPSQKPSAKTRSGGGRGGRGRGGL